MPDRELKPWQVLSEREVYRRDPYLSIHLQDLRLPDGRVIEDYLRVQVPEFVIVIAVTESGEFVVERNYKHGPRRIILDMPAGMLEPGENAEEGARRELLEETGYEASACAFLGAFWLHANYGCARAHFYLATGCRKVAEPDSGDLEEMEILLMAAEELYGALDRGEIHLLSMATAIALARSLPPDRLSFRPGPR